MFRTLQLVFAAEAIVATDLTVMSSGIQCSVLNALWVNSGKVDSSRLA
jgi:hypothetical protein